MTSIENKSETHLIVGSIEVLGDMSGAGVKTIKNSIAQLENAQSTQAEKMYDYWSTIADDGIITPEEKKTLKYQMTVILSEEPVLLSTAEDAGIADTTEEYTAYVAAYNALYTYVYKTLHLFDFMDANTTLPNRDLFISRFTDYYTTRDTLRDAIENGRDAAVEEAAKDYTDDAVSELRDTLTTTRWITSDILDSGLQNEINDLVAASEQGFVTEEIIAKIQELYNTNEEGVYSYVQQLQEELTAVVVDLKRNINSAVSQSSDEVDIKVQNLADSTWAALEVKEDEIIAAAGKSNEVASALSVQTDRISALVSGYNAQAYMTASVGLTWLVTGAMFAYYEDGLSSAEITEFESRFFTVYEKIESSNSANVTGSLEYQMISDVTDTQKKTLANFLKAAGSINSYIILSADQILLDGVSIFESGKLSQTYTDYTPAESYSDDKISAALDSLGDLAVEDKVEESMLGTTVITGGYIKTALINVDDIFAGIISANRTYTNRLVLGSSDDDEGEIVSSNFYNESGEESGAGFRFKYSGDSTIHSLVSNSESGVSARGFELLGDGTAKINYLETKYIHPSNSAAIENIHHALQCSPYLGLNLQSYTNKLVSSKSSIGFTPDYDGWVYIPAILSAVADGNANLRMMNSTGAWYLQLPFFPVVGGNTYFVNNNATSGVYVDIYFVSTLGTLTFPT